MLAISSSDAFPSLHVTVRLMPTCLHRDPQACAARRASYRAHRRAYSLELCHEDHQLGATVRYVCVYHTAGSPVVIMSDAGDRLSCEGKPTASPPQKSDS